MNNIQYRRPGSVAGKELRPNEFQAIFGSEGYPSEANRFLTESDIRRDLDAVLTDGSDVLLDQNGSLLYA